MKKALTNCASGVGRYETYGETLNLSLEAKKVHVKGAPAIVYSMKKHSLGQVPFCRLVEFSRFPIRLSFLAPWDMGDT